MGRIKQQAPTFRTSKRKDGYYDIRYEQDGETKTKSTGTKDPKAAERFRAQFAADWSKPTTNAKAVVSDAIDLYWAYKEATIKQPVSARAALNNVVRLMGELSIAKLTQRDFDTYARTRLSEKRKNGAGTVSEGTVSKELRLFRAALNYAHRERLITNAVTFRLPTKSSGVRDVWITKDQANRIIENASPHIALFVLIALSTAKRREAILQLKWDAVDLTASREAIDFGDDVGNKRRGSTPISGISRLIDRLKAAKETSTSEHVIEFRGKPLLDVKNGVKQACVRAGIEVITSHVLKHSAITWMVQGGVGLERIAKFSNTSKQMIEQVYGHHSPEYLREVSNAVTF
jgi:integrase